MEAEHGGTLARQLITLIHEGTIGGLTDGQLLDRFAHGPGDSAESAFAALVERHGPMVHRVCRRLLGGPQDADDAFQATFLILARRAGAIRRRESVGPWLFGVALRVAACDRAARDRRRARERRAAGRISGDDAGRWRDGQDRAEVARVVLEEVGRLPERYRAAVVLCDLEGLGHEEAARLVGCPVGTIKSRQARGRERLRGRLSRRGLAPSAFPLLPGPVDAALPPALARSASRVATAAGSARNLAAGVVPAAAETLAREAMKSMLLTKIQAAGLVAMLSAGLIAAGAAVSAPQDPGPAQAQPRAPEKPGPMAEAGGDAGQLTAAGTIFMPDGSPAAGATVTTTAGPDLRPIVARADERGRFRLRGLFEVQARLHARSADEDHQSLLAVSSDVARTAFGSPLEIRLAPAKSHEVAVFSAGRPVEGARVVASGVDFGARGVTGRDGKARLRLPAGSTLTELSAWHPDAGVAGLRGEGKIRPGELTLLSLLPRAPHEIRAVDPEGKPVAGVELAVNVRTEGSDWISLEEIEGAHFRTDAGGVATVPWMPCEGLKYVDVKCVGRDWKVDEPDISRVAEGFTTAHVRREREVRGRLVMPPGANPEGVLITGFAFGPKGRGDVPHARAGRDGTFTLRVPSEHAYILGVTDGQWAGDPWSGVILEGDASKPAEIAIRVYPATPALARVTRGPRHDPVVDAWVQISTRGNVKWVDAGGEKRSGSSGAMTWLRTDAAGVARAGVGKGEHEFRVSVGPWNEEKKFRVDSEKPVEVEFHRPWTGERRASGRLLVTGAPYQPSPTLAARAWSPRSGFLPLEFEPAVRPDGTFEVAYDAPSLSLFFIDRERRRAGSARLGIADSTADVSLEPTAEYGGTLLDEHDRPMADRALQVLVKTSDYEAVAAQRTDRGGRFRFEVVPAGVPLELRVRNDPGEPEYFLFDRDRLFQPGEVRADDRVSPRPQAAPAPAAAARPSKPLADRLGNLGRDIRPTGLRGLVLLQGDPSREVVGAVDRLLDDERTRSVLGYRPLRVDFDRSKSDAALVAGRGWPAPGPGEITLVALDGDNGTIAATRIAAADADRAGVAFLDEHRPPARDAVKWLEGARREARESGRRVWVIHGGPRCAPCFLLARWIDDHHQVLEKDFVVVKLMDGVDDRVGEAMAGLPEQPGEGIPWFAITEPDGTILATSVGPLGNAGFPGSVEGLRHFRQMLDRSARKLTPAGRDDLIRSLSEFH